MDKLLGFPKIDPHGSLFLIKTGRMEWIEYSKLSDCKAGETVTLAAVTIRQMNSLNF